jgi:NADH-quinone oxidoreductase subunit C
MDDGKLDALGQTIVSALPGAATEHAVAFGQLTVAVQADKIVDVVTFLRDDPGCRFVSFTDVTAVDYPGREKRFDVIYHLLSPTLNARIRLRAEAGETTQVPSIIEVFPGADWFEREAYDLYGVIFTGHPDMRRLLTDYGFDGHRCARIFRSPASSRCVTTTRRSGCSMNPSVSIRNSANSIFSRHGKAPIIRCCPAMRRRGRRSDHERSTGTA